MKKNLEQKQDLSAHTLSKKVKIDAIKWNSMPSESEIKKTIENIEKRGMKVYLVENKKQALEKIKEIIPSGSEVMNGSSTTLIEIGFVDYLKSKAHSWKNLHEKVFAETDQAKRSDLRRHATASEYFLASVNAIAMSGELVATDQSGSRVGAFPFAAKKLVLVSGVNKIVPTLSDALKRIEEYALPLENERAKIVYGSGSQLGKTVIIHHDIFPDRTTLVLVKEKLGF